VLLHEAALQAAREVHGRLRQHGGAGDGGTD
jgi:hypothetical protein